MHVDEGTIHAWLDGELPADEATAVESHVATCAPCAAAVAEARGLMAASSRILGALDDVPAKVVPAVTKAPAGAPVRSARRWWQRPQFAAAAGVAVMAIGSAVIYQRSGEPSAAEQDAVMASTPVATMDSAVAADRAAAPAAAVEPLSRAREGASSLANAVTSREGARADAPAAPPPAPTRVATSTEARAEQAREQDVTTAVAGGRASGSMDTARAAPAASPLPVRTAVAVDSLVANERRRLADEVVAQRSVPAAASPAEMKRAIASSRVDASRAGRCYVIARSAATDRLEVPARLELLDAAGPMAAGVQWQQVRVDGATGTWFWRTGPGRVEVARITNGVVGEVFALTPEGGATPGPCA